MLSDYIIQAIKKIGAVLLEDQGKTPFTILTYRHGNFGPAWLGPLRRWFFPSPLQSNWRLYLAQPMKNADPVSTIVFVQNILDSTLYSVGTRVFSDALLAHLAQRFVLTRTDRDFRVDIEPGSGSAQRLHLHAGQSVSATLPGCFGGLFANWEAAVSTVCKQDGAVCQLPGSDLLAFARIDLPIDVRQVQPFELLSGGLNCPLLLTLDAQPEALCFLLPSVRFRVLSERVLHG